MSEHATSQSIPLSAIILAAGMSSRCRQFKPLLPLGGETIIERVIRIYRDAGISNVIVVTGFRANDLIPIVEHMHAKAVLNPLYQQGMFSSVTAGLSILPDACPAFFIHPVDIPLVRPHTIRRLQEAFAHESHGVYYPVFLSERGHPPLISGNFRQSILMWSGSGGLRGFLNQHEADAREISVADRFILQDIDIPKDYRQAVGCLSQYDVPSDGECRMLMKDVPENIRRHCDVVAAETERIGARLNAVGCRLDMSLMIAAARIHDVARDQPNHAAAGARILKHHGFGRTADIVAQHMDFPPPDNAPITETEVVYIADKRVQADRVTGIEMRFESKLHRYAENPDACRQIIKRRDQARKSLRRIEDRIGALDRYPFELSATPTNEFNPSR